MTSSSTLDGLPKQFITAMRTLFDIMDDKHTGYVNIADIENRWQEDDAKGLPKGVIENLRKVTPPNGMLTFDRFCSGLKMCLIRNQVDRKQHPEGTTVLKPTNRPPSAPLLDLEPNPPKPNWGNTVAIRPNNVISQQQRTISMPLLPPKDVPMSTANNLETVDIPHTFEKQVPNVNKQPSSALYGPPKPPRSAAGLVVPDRPLVPLPQSGSNNIDRNEIRNALQNWQMGLMMGNDGESKSQSKNHGLLRTGRSMGDGKASTGQNDGQPQVQQGGGLYQKNKANARNRREPRRHTLQNGIDYSMLKRMKQIEQEKDVLIQGLSAVEKAREWYLKQVAVVQEKMKYLGKMGYVVSFYFDIVVV